MLWVIDDFYPNPDEIRAKALELEFRTGQQKVVMHPGSRALTNAKDQRSNLYWIKNRQYLKNRWRSICNAEPVEWEKMTSNCAFNLCTNDKAARFSWVHSDDAQSGPHPMYACVLYLTPNPPPHSGTIMFSYKGDIRDVQVKDRQAEKHYPPIRGNYYDSPTSVNPDWRPHVTVENRYNRCIIYEADMLHAPQDAGFGKTKEEARLTQLGFWYGEKR